MSITYKIKGKRVWTDEAIKIISQQEIEKSFETFLDGLRESGFRKRGEYAGVEKWSLGDTKLTVTINPHNYTYKIMTSSVEFSIREVEVFFDLIRKYWKDMTNSFSTTP